jgi:hypothetical protein
VARSTIMLISRLKNTSGQESSCAGYLLPLAADRQSHKGDSSPHRLGRQPGAADFDHHQLSRNVAQKSRFLGDGSSIRRDRELLVQQICECRYLLDRQADLTHMEHRSPAKGSICLVVQAVMHNIFEDIIGRITNIERTCIEMGKEDFIPSSL